MSDTDPQAPSPPAWPVPADAWRGGPVLEEHHGEMCDGHECHCDELGGDPTIPIPAHECHCVEADDTTDPQAPLPYEWTDSDGDGMWIIGRTLTAIGTDGQSVVVNLDEINDPVALARAVLAAAGSTARVVETGDGHHSAGVTPTCDCEGESDPPSTVTVPPTHCAVCRPDGWEEPRPGGDQGFSATTEDLPPEVHTLLLRQEQMLAGWAESAPEGQRASPRQQELWRALHEAADAVRELTPSRAEKPDNISSETPTRLRCGRDPQCTGCQSCWEEAMASQPGGDPRYTQEPGEPDLEAIRARADAATPGPWEDGVGDTITTADGTDVYTTEPGHDTVCVSGADLEFIVSARTDVPALLAEVERLRGERDWLGHAWRSALQRGELDRAERDDYQVRLRATDRSWSRVAAERDRLRTAWTSARRGRDEAMTAVDRLVEESDRHARQRDEARAERDRYRDSWTSARRELATRVERLELAQSDHDHLADRVAALEQGGGHDAEEDR